MQVGSNGASGRALAAGISTAAVAAVLAILAPGARADLVTPHTVTPHTVTPHVVTKPAPPPPKAPAPAPNAAPVPSAPAPSSPPSGSSPSPSRSGYAPRNEDDPVTEQEVPGYGVPGGPYDPPFPEGLPNHWNEDCGLECKQEWFEWYQARYEAAWSESLTGGVSKEAVGLLRDEVKTIEDEITGLGGTPGEDDRPAGGEADQGGEMIILIPTGAAPSPPSDPGVLRPSGPSDLLPDAISGVGELLTDDLGSWDLASAAEAVGFATGVSVIMQLITGGSTQKCARPKATDDGVTVCPR